MISCVDCGHEIQPGAKVCEVYVVSKVRDGMVWSSRSPGAAHVRCDKPRLLFKHRRLSPYQLSTKDPASMDVCPSHQCVDCGKAFEPGDRVVQVLHVQKIDMDPVLKAPGVVVNAEHEFAHRRCESPKLVTPGVILVP